MDEQAWLAGERPFHMIEYLRQNTNLNRTKVGRRKFRLFSCACARRMWDLLDEVCRDLVEGAEQLVDGKITKERSSQLFARVEFAHWGEDFPRMRRGYGVAWAIRESRYPAQMAQGAASCVMSEVIQSSALEAGAEAASRKMHEEHRQQARLLREIFGNPFRPHPQRRFPADVRGLAEAAYEDALHYPVLADALADLGEDEAAEHCRLPGHVKGCHVVDWILGRA